VVRSPDITEEEPVRKEVAMPYDVQIRHVPQQAFAVVRGRANIHTIGDRIMALLSEVWDVLKNADVRHMGHNVVLYWDEPGKALLLTDEGVPIEVGVQVVAPFERMGHVTCAAIPGGTVATVVHRGLYQKLSEAHTAVRRWCAEHRYALAGPNWEIYGDWTDNPDELRTDVFYLLQESEQQALDQSHTSDGP
jgi:effector-binding domain-containing protein